MQITNCSRTSGISGTRANLPDLILIPSRLIYHKLCISDILRIVPHQLAEEKIDIAEPMNLEVLPWPVDPHSLIAPLESKNHLILFEQMRDVQLLIAKLSIYLFNRFPEIRSPR